MRKWSCWQCGSVPDGCAEFTHGQYDDPDPGDVSICLDCGVVGVFTKGGIRQPSDEERAAFDSDPDILLAEAYAAVVRDRVAKSE
jgi:hypothetical protein